MQYHQEMSIIVMFVGLQGSTKSSIISELAKMFPSAIVLSRDVLGGTVIDLQKHISSKGIYFLDATFLTKALRKPFITLSKKLTIPILCVYLRTTIEDSQIRILHRQWEKYGRLFLTAEDIKQAKIKDPNVFPPVVLFKARKELQEPLKNEGFDCFDQIDIQSPLSIFSSYPNKALFIDIDGTVRDVSKLTLGYPIENDEVEIYLSIPDLLKKYQNDGYKIIGISNQSGVAKGVLTKQRVEELFQETVRKIGIGDFPIYYCPHRAAPITCYCRKPQMGLFIEAIEKFSIDPRKSIFVGDMKTDETVAKRLGIKFLTASYFRQQKIE